MLPADLIAYVTRAHGRTLEAARLLPDELVGFRPRPGEFTAGEILTHIASTRLMNVATIRSQRIEYRGHQVPAGASCHDLQKLLLRTSKTSIARLSDADLAADVTTQRGSKVPAWQLLISGLVEHEAHHRSQFCEYLSAAGVEPPPLYGVHAEDLPRFRRR